MQMDANARMPLEKELSKIRPLVALADSLVQRTRDQCGYGWVQLSDFVVTV